MHGPYYDLLVFQYGVKCIVCSCRCKFSMVWKKFMPVIKNETAFPKYWYCGSGYRDRAFSYNGTRQSATGIDSLIKIQAGIAAASGCSFYNLYQSMAAKHYCTNGQQQLHRWLTKIMYPNIRGAEILGAVFTMHWWKIIINTNPTLNNFTQCLTRIPARY